MSVASILPRLSYDVAILIVTYNSAEQIRTCLQSVEAQRERISQHVIVLDNASSDETVSIVRAEFPDVELITPGRNLGFAAGVNAAARYANAEFLLLLNPDTEILEHAVDRIVDFARAHPGQGLYGGRTLKPDRTLEPSSCWGLPTLWSHFLFAVGFTTLAPRSSWLDPESLGSWPRDTVREVGVITGCFLLVSRLVWQQLGGFDERYFMYGEDVDLAARAHRAGYRPLLSPEAQLIHEVGQSSARPIDKMLLLFKGKAQLARTHWRSPAAHLALLCLLAGVALRSALSILVSLVRPDTSLVRWRQLWSRRQEWIAGYSSGESSARSSSIADPSTASTT